ncbi:ras-related protein rab-39b-like [Stylonychia lemnae]|uniref:Ras-related protein rab-39b-like n=1 Tax=Stylonychia lemnae TaxID=5949 RepID=A0A078B4E0_STYLE|nr:ras-related protein rab-39b-like [Stylonychia lemnae]|eukprot:CDW89349.1 ras-related protein rab-39b-like [Stylonychia lemnae]
MNFTQYHLYPEEENTPHFSNNLKSFNAAQENIGFGDTLKAVRATQSSVKLVPHKLDSSNDISCPQLSIQENRKTLQHQNSIGHSSQSLSQSQQNLHKCILIGDCNVGKTSIIRRLTQNTFSFDRVPTTSVDEVSNFIMQLKPTQSNNNRSYNNNSRYSDISWSKNQKSLSMISLPTLTLNREQSENSSSVFNNSSNYIQTQISSDTGTDRSNIIGLEIWDTLGQERHSSLVSSYYKNASGIMIVYDVTNMESFMNIRSWLVELEDRLHNLPHEESYILVGNKCDLECSRQVTKQKGKQLADKYGICFIEVSAMSGKNINHAFQILSQNILVNSQLDENIEERERREQISNNSIRIGEFSFSFKVDSVIEDSLQSSCIDEQKANMIRKFSESVNNSKNKANKNKGQSKKKSRCC